MLRHPNRKTDAGPGVKRASGMSTDIVLVRPSPKNRVISGASEPRPIATAVPEPQTPATPRTVPTPPKTTSVGITPKPRRREETFPPYVPPTNPVGNGVVTYSEGGRGL